MVKRSVVSPCKTELVVGRSKTCGIVIGLLGLSRRHARILRTSEGVSVEDLGSQNGTWVNNERIEGPHVLHHGDMINFYDYTILFLEEREAGVVEVDEVAPSRAIAASPG